MGEEDFGDVYQPPHPSGVTYDWPLGLRGETHSATLALHEALQGREDKGEERAALAAPCL